MMITILMLGVLAIPITYGFINVMFRYIDRHRVLLSEPNERSLHTIPTPCGGGLPILLFTLMGLVIYLTLVAEPLSTGFLFYLLGALIIGGISWADDRKPVSSAVRLIAHIIGAVLLINGFGYWEMINLPVVGDIALGWLGLPLTLMWLVGFTNAFNFMDGIDGLSGTQAVLAGLAWTIIGWVYGQPVILLVGWLITTTSLGFLVHNWSPARIFMGDVGSAFLGFTFAALPIMLTTLSLQHPQIDRIFFMAILVIWPFLFDSGLTVLRRLKNRENIFAAHQSHLYQRLVGGIGYGHRDVTLLYSGLIFLGLLLARLWYLKAINAYLLATTIMMIACGLVTYVSIQESRKTALTQASRPLQALPVIRNRYLLAIDAVVLSIIPIVALTFRFDGFGWWPKFTPALLFFTAITICLYLGVFYQFGIYRRYWLYANVSDLYRMLLAIIVPTVILSLAGVVLQPLFARYGYSLPRTLPVLVGALSLITLGGTRVSLRGLYDWYRNHGFVVGGRRVLIVGAGEAGTLAVREIRANPQLEMEPVAFVDDDPEKIGKWVQGLPVLASSDQLPGLVDQYKISLAVIAIPSAPLKRQHELVKICETTGSTPYTLTGVYELLAGQKTLSQLPRVDVNQLLGRRPIRTNQDQLKRTLQGKRILITGAGGSIGRELCHQVAACQPKEMILLGHGENSIFEINLDLRLTFPDLRTFTAIVDVRDQDQIGQTVARFRPNIIFHAAAHKHVHLMQTNCLEAVKNNILGTRNVVLAAEKSQVQGFVLISTDKAVNPTSIMGATKRVAELYVMGVAERSGLAYMAVRFGNVLGSRGSVLPVFQRQIAAGGPLTLTDPEMTRYFMTIPEAVQLVLHAVILGRGREIFVLDMGRPVKIVDLANNLLKSIGLQPEEDIDIIFKGAGPGEKLNEELFLEGEDYHRTSHEQIFVAKTKDAIRLLELEMEIAQLIEKFTEITVETADDLATSLLNELRQLIDRYEPIIQKTKPAVEPSVDRPRAVNPKQSPAFGTN